jgi:hypothetical protein
VTKSVVTSQRLRAALAINQGGIGSSSQVGDRKADPWVPANRELRSVLARLHPPQSEGRFFDRLNDGDGSGRLEIVEWIKNLLVRHQNHQVIVFDPCFEDAGIGLIVPNAGSHGDYIVFTSLPKPEAAMARTWYAPFLRVWTEWRKRLKPPVAAKTRINNLLASCEQLKPLMRSVRLRVYGLKSGTLHDRYILIADRGGLPTAGFHLSNSIQKANENYPLLITPIPLDVLFKVHDYAIKILKHAFEAPSPTIEGASGALLLFDSKAALAAKLRRIEPLDFLDRHLAGDVLARWTGDHSLRRLEGDALRERMRSLGLLSEGSLAIEDGPGLKGCLDQQSGNFDNFSAQWGMIAEILANTHAGSSLHTADLSTETAFLSFLAEFLSRSFERKHDSEVDSPLAHVASRYFQEPVEVLLASSYRPESFFHPVKYAVLNWAEFFALQILWHYAPEELLSITEAQTATLSDESQFDGVKLSLLSQIASDIALGVQYELSDRQRDRLIRSSNGLLKWMGLNCLKSQLERPNGVFEVVRYTASWNQRERILVLGWMIQHYATKQNGETILRQLIDSLFQVMPRTITAEDANLLVNSMRGHVRTLGWTEPWLYRDVVFPLLAAGRISADDLCDIWVRELLGSLEQALIDGTDIFRRNAEGRVIEIAATLFGRSGLQRQMQTVAALRAVLTRVRRNVQQPLASTSNWGKWNISLVVAMWIFAFTKWAAHSLVKPSGIEKEIEQLSSDSRSVALVRPISDWQSDRGVEPASLAKFIDEVGEI